ncbi:HD domain-containing phosphohydrolase [Planctomycetota bacterium]
MLVIEDGSSKGRSVPLQGKKTLIGRGHDCDLQVLDESLSRVHCLLEKKADAYILTDLNSRNGTFLNGTKAKSVKINAGDVISIGDTNIQFNMIEISATGSSLADLLETANKPANRVQKRLDPSKTPLVAASREELFGPDSSGRLQRDLATIYKIGNLISTENDLSVLCDLIMDSILDVVEVDRGFLLLGDDIESVHAAVIRGAEGATGGKLTLSSTILAESLEKGMAVMSTDAMDDERFKGEDSIVMHNITSVMCVPLEAEGDILGAIYVDTIAESSAFDEADLELVSAIGHQAGVAIERAKLMEDLENLFYDSVSTLVATIEASDTYTRGHSERVTMFAVDIAHSLGLDSDTIAAVRLTGLLHDIGKIGIPAAILNKKERLADDEWETIKTHPKVGAGIISNIRRMKESVVSAVKHHHEKWDGTGYPDGLAGEDIPPMSRILSVADAYDAMTSKRPYRDYVMTVEQAIEELRDKAGEQFDQKAVAAFLEGRTESDQDESS